jgi:hypothetical protein
MNFTITTGSGRHKGKFTIIVKPSVSSSTKIVSMYQEGQDVYRTSKAAERNEINDNK